MRAGAFAAPVNPGSSPPLFQASSYEFDDLDDVEAIYAGDRPGRIYGRYGGPNGAQFEAAMAELEDAEGAVGSAAGMSAIAVALTSNLPPGGAILATREIYGGTYDLFENDFKQRGFAGRIRRSKRPRRGAKRAGADAPERPLPRGFDQSAGSRGRFAGLGGACPRAGALSRSSTPRSPRRCSSGRSSTASISSFTASGSISGATATSAPGCFPAAASSFRARESLVRTGATIPHFEAWLALRGLRTLALRMERHSSNAAEVAAFLASAEGVTRVHHPSLPSHPDNALARRLYPRGTGGMVAFDLTGGRDAVDRFLRGLTMISIVHSLGEVASTISYPAASSHRALPAQTRRALGVSDSTLRLSVGIENAADIVADLSRALAGLGERIRA